MFFSRRSLLATGTGLAGLSAMQSPRALSIPSTRIPNSEIADLIERSAAANQALLNGDVDTYRSMISFTDNFTLMTPFGGEPSRGKDITYEQWEAMRSFFRNGTLLQEVIESYRSDELIVLVAIERTRVEVGGLPAQDWPLRVTLVYQREGNGWGLAHRHADALFSGINLKLAAAVARGEHR